MKVRANEESYEFNASSIIYVSAYELFSPPVMCIALTQMFPCILNLLFHVANKWQHIINIHLFTEIYYSEICVCVKLQLLRKFM